MEIEILFPEIGLFTSCNNDKTNQASFNSLKILNSRMRRLKKKDRLKSLKKSDSIKGSLVGKAAGQMKETPPSSEQPSDAPPPPSTEVFGLKLSSRR